MKIAAYIYLITAYFYKFSSAQFECPFQDYLNDCDCYPKKRILSCKNATELPENVELLENMGKPYEFLEVLIQDSKIDRIKQNNFGNISTTTLVISDNLNLTEIEESNLMKIATNIIIERNRELNIENVMKAIKSNVNLKVLKVSDTKLQNIAGSNFVNLKGLEKIYLQNNQIKNIEANAFASLENLIELDLEGNQIKNLGEKTFAFKENAKRLVKINLNRNNLTSSDLNNAFHLSENITLHIYLESNEITNFPKEPFGSICNNNENKLYLSDNQIDCKWNDIEWTFIETEKLKNQVFGLLCANINHLSLFELNLNDFPDKPTTLPTSPSPTTPAPTTTKQTAAPMTTKQTAAPTTTKQTAAPTTTKQTAAPTTTKQTAAPTTTEQTAAPTTTKQTAAPTTTKQTAPPTTTKQTAAPTTTKQTAAPTTTKQTAAPTTTKQTPVPTTTKQIPASTTPKPTSTN